MESEREIIEMMRAAAPPGQPSLGDAPGGNGNCCTGFVKPVFNSRFPHLLRKRGGIFGRELSV